MAEFLGMTRYYFDTRDHHGCMRDTEGVEIGSLKEVKLQASRAMADLARDELPGAANRDLVIEVRTDSRPVLRVSLRLEIDDIST